jgi:hypothetical protein
MLGAGAGKIEERTAANLGAELSEVRLPTVAKEIPL